MSTTTGPPSSTPAPGAQSKPNPLLGVGLAFAAGACSLVGAALILILRRVKNLNIEKVIAASLSMAASVMIFVSLVELFQISRDSFLKGGAKAGKAMLLSTVSFFAGFLVPLGFGALVHKLRRGCGKNQNEGEVALPRASFDADALSLSQQAADCCGLGVPLPDPASAPSPDRPVSDGGSVFSYDHLELHHHQHGHKHGLDAPRERVKEEKERERGNIGLGKEDKQRLHNAGIQAAIAIGLHNLPEGIATYIGAANDTKIGATIAIAIAVHNIPEGFAIAIPIYYSTGSMRKAMLWSLIGTIAEPVGALLAWAILADQITDTTFGVLFGLVSGMMTLISLKELLPSAVRLDPQDTVTTVSGVVGMMVMAASLILFEYTAE